jgi:hypothetical protein
MREPCCGPESEAPGPEVVVDFMYLDLSVCPRCQDTGRNLERAISKLKRVLSETGTEIVLNKIQVRSEDQARELGFVASPTIRVNGRDIQPYVRQSRCEACGSLCGDECECRVWDYQGREYPGSPVGMIIDAILSAVYGGRERESGEPAGPVTDLPGNLRRFFAGKAKKEREQPGSASPRR